MLSSKEGLNSKEGFVCLFFFHTEIAVFITDSANFSASQNTVITVMAISFFFYSFCFFQIFSLLLSLLFSCHLHLFDSSKILQDFGDLDRPLNFKSEDIKNCLVIFMCLGKIFRLGQIYRLWERCLPEDKREEMLNMFEHIERELTQLIESLGIN